MRIKSVNPFTEEVISEFERMTPDDAVRQTDRSRRAFDDWKALPAAGRVAFLAKLGDHLLAKKHVYAELITREMGKPIRESVAEVEKCAWASRYFLEYGPRFLEAERSESWPEGSFVMFQPLGVVLGIMPWNFPFWQVFRFAVPALMAGNAVLIKHASNVPACALAIEECFTKSGFPADVFKSLLIDPKAALTLVEEDLVDAVSLTGSVQAGEAVAAAAGRRIKKTVLELGGSDPFIVLGDAEMDRAVEMAVSARMLNSGQSCIAAKRFIVVEEVAAEFKEMFLGRLRLLKMGDPMDETTDVGPVAKKEVLDLLRGQLDDAVAKGAEIHRGGSAPGRGLFFQPCAVFNTSKEMRVLKEEVFGPMAPVIEVKDEDEAVRAANDTPFGLGASIWSRDTDRAKRLAERVEAGTVAINDIVRSDPRLPFGGIKKSGIGRELSHYGLKEFVNIKTVVVNE